MKKLLLLFMFFVSVTLFADWGNEVRLIASDGEFYDAFGCSVSLSGDYAAIGAHWDDDSGLYSGSAYIFHYNGLNWVEKAKLTASDGEANDEFGMSVSISGNYAVIGAYKDDDNGVDSGSAYIFYYNGLSWVEQAKLTASDGEAYDFFGESVAITDNYILVGALNAGDNNTGAAYVYEKIKPLAVTLSSFTTTYTMNNLTISWTTESETNMNGFKIWKSTNDNQEDAESISELISAQNQNFEHTYFYVDSNNVELGQTYYYWLEAIGYDGISTFYGYCTIKIDDSEIDDLPQITKLLANYPNPFNPETKISFKVKEDETATLFIYNMKAQLVFQKYYATGNYEVYWNGSKYSSGIYFYKLQSPTYSKIKKMIMLK